MRIAHRLVLDGPEAEPLVGVVGRLLEPPIVEDEHLGLGIFEIKLTIVRALQTAGELSARGLTVEAGAIEKGSGR
jgi:hypothetical protein